MHYGMSRMAECMNEGMREYPLYTLLHSPGNWPTNSATQSCTPIRSRCLTPCTLLTTRNLCWHLSNRKTHSPHVTPSCSGAKTTMRQAAAEASS